MNARIEEAKVRIQNGADFNGVIYGKRANKNNLDLFIYLDGEYVSLTRSENKFVDEWKEEIMDFFSVVDDNNEVEAEAEVILSNNVSKTEEDVKDVISSKENQRKEGRTEWWVNGEVVRNNLNYTEMYNRYGMDFE